MIIKNEEKIFISIKFNEMDVISLSFIILYVCGINDNPIVHDPIKPI